MLMKRMVCLLIALAFLLVGCNKMPTVSDDVKPEEHFAHYKTLTELYGTARMDTFKALNVAQKDIVIYHDERLGIPQKESYAGIDFNIWLRFINSKLSGVEYEATYQYPDEKDKMLQDLVTINKALVKDFGEASDTSIVFNWVEAYLDEKWDRDIAYWRDASVLVRLVDSDFSGSLLYWDMTNIASKTVKETLGEDRRHGLSIRFFINEQEGFASVSVEY